MKLYLLAFIMFAAALYLWLTPPTIEPMELRAAKEVSVDEYLSGSPAQTPAAQSSGDFIPNNAKQKQPGYQPGCDPCAGRFGQRYDEEQAVFDGTTCTRGSAYNCAVAAEGWKCRLRTDAQAWGIIQ